MFLTIFYSSNDAHIGYDDVYTKGLSYIGWGTGDKAKGDIACVRIGCVIKIGVVSLVEASEELDFLVIEGNFETLSSSFKLNDNEFCDGDGEKYTEENQ